jgi:hypothetical protein
MAFLNLSSLSSAVFEGPQTLNEDVRILGAPRYHVFLSYRHEDRNYVPGVARFLKNLGTGVYVDFLDNELSAAPNDRTAPILRSRILQSRKLIQLITPNSSSSRWMPWELGLGDGLLGYANSITLPVVNNYNASIEQDYLNMYGHIETANSQDRTRQDWAVLFPDGTAKWFTQWLAS